MTFIVSFIFIFIFYATGLYRVVAGQIVVFPALGKNGSWLLTAMLIYIALALAALTLRQFEEVVWPALPKWRRAITRRTGIYRLDDFGFRLSILALILFLATDVLLVPLGLASAIGFASLRRISA